MVSNLQYATPSNEISPDNEGEHRQSDEGYRLDGTRRLEGEEQHQTLLRWADPRQSPNIAAELEKHRLDPLGNRILEEIQIDETSRADWLNRSKGAMDLAMQIVKPSSNAPWPNSSNVNYPLMTVAAHQFAARAYPAVIADQNVVRGVVHGDDDGIPQIDPDGQPMQGPDGQPLFARQPGELRLRADRIGHHMSYQLLEEQPEWEPETDKLLHILPIVGCAFRKTYFDPGEGRNMSVLVYPKNLIINYWAKSIYLAPRVTEEIEIYPYELEEMKRAGIFLDRDYGPPDGDTQDKDSPHKFYEQHRRLDLDGDGYTEPYIVTSHKETGKIARIHARYDAAGIKFNQAAGQITKIVPTHYYTPYEFFPNPEGGVYGVGFGQLLAPINKSVNTTLNMMFDAGHLQVAGGGFIGKGLSMHSGMVKLAPGRYKTVNALGSTVRDAIVMLDHKGPSPVLFQLLGTLIEAGNDIASIKDVLTGDQTASNVPATTILAIIEQGLKVFTAIFKRVHRSLKSEYDKIYRLNTIYLEDQSSYRVGEETRMIRRDDYVRGAGIKPVSDPKHVSDMQKLGRAEFLKGFAGDEYIDQMELRRRLLDAADVEDIEDLMSEPKPNAEMIRMAAQLELEEMQAKANSINKMAAAYKFLAEGDEKLASIGQSFIAGQLKELEIMINSFGKDDPSNGGSGTNPGNQRDNGRGLSGVAPSPGN